MLTWLKSLFFRRAPTGPQQKLRAFSLNEGTISKGCVRVENDNWRIDSAENQTVRLFDLQHPEVEQCLLTYLSSRDQEREPERPRISGDVVPPARSRRVLFEGQQQAVSSTTDWAAYEIPFYLRKNQRPDLIKLNIAVEGTGTVWLRNVEILKTPLSS